MSPLDDFSVQPIDQRLSVLKKRQRHLMLWFSLSLILVVVILVSLLFQKEIVYRFFDLSLHIQTLDLPYHVQALVPFKQPVDYFFNLLSWFGWLFLKIFVAFIGSFIFVSLLKKIRFFQRRFQAWTQRFVAWLIAFILLWSGLSYLQYDWKNDTKQAYQQWMSYQDNILESQIAQDLQHAEVTEIEKAYVLAQVALLHEPRDQKAAKYYVEQLNEAEKNQPSQFKQYGFKPEQLWVMQQQLYGKSQTPVTQQLEGRVQQAEKFSHMISTMSWILLVVIIGLSLLLYVLARHLKQRYQRIGIKLDV